MHRPDRPGRDAKRKRGASPPDAGAPAPTGAPTSGRAVERARDGRDAPHRAAAGQRVGATRRTTSPSTDLLYGRNAVVEALRGRRRLHRLLVTLGVHEDDRLRALLAAAAERNIPIDRPPRPLLDDLTSGANHQGVALECAPYPYADLDIIIAAAGVVLLLDHLQDPQNFGTLLRTADAVAAAGVVIPQDRAVAVTPAVVNASAGAVEHLPVARVPNLTRAAETLKRAGRWIIGLDTGPDAVELFTTDLPTPAALVVGAEGTGLTPNLRRHCDLIASLPMHGRVGSLNAATAGSIALYDLLRRNPSTVL